MREVPAGDVVTGINPIELEDDSLVEATIVVVKVSRPGGQSELHRALTAGMSHWEAIGMLTDALDNLRGLTAWDEED